MNIREHFDKDKLHHAYLIEGNREEIIPEILKLLEGMGINTLGNPDFCQIVVDGFKIEEAFSLREMAAQKSFSAYKKIFLVSTNSFTRDAQGVLLKIFEEPAEGTHFFIVTSDASPLLPTLRSRFYFISAESGPSLIEEAEKFVSLPPARRIDFLKDFLKDDKDDEPDITVDSARARAGKFLNAIESILHKSLKRSDTAHFDQIFKVREYLRQPGSSVKNLMESLALIIPVIQ